MLTTFATYGMISSDLTRSLKTTAAQPQVARESAYYLANIGNVKSIDDFLGNDRLFSFAMKAFGLQDMTYAKAFMRKVLTEGIDKQAQMISAKFDIDLKDPTKLNKFITRFATMWDVDNPTTDTTSTNVLFAQPLEAGIGIDLLSSLQNLKLGGH